MLEENIYTLMVKHLTKEASTEEQEELLVWLSECETRRRLFRSLKDAFDLGRFEAIVDSSDAPAEWQKIAKRIMSEAKPKLKPVPEPKPAAAIGRFRKIWKYAAIFVLGLACMKSLDALFGESHEPQQFAVQVETGRGERSKVTLPDGTVVMLNVSSQITYAYDQKAKTRTAAFRGEGFFEVAKSDAPFVVTLPGDLRARVLGTAFNLSAYEDDASVTTSLLEGSVALEHPSGEKMTLVQGQSAVFDRTTQRMALSEKNPSRASGWMNNRLYMDDMSLAQMCKYLERRFDVEITMTGEIGEQFHYTGVLQEESITDVLDALCRLSRIKYQKKGRIIRIE